MKKWICLVLVFSFLLGFTACNNEKGDHIINFQGETVPKNLDPLLASSQSEKMVMENIYESLFSLDDTGKVLPGAAKEYTFSDNGKTCTVRLQEDLFWHNGTPIVADDFVFAMQRAVSPQTKASCAGQLTCIEGGKEILAGTRSADTLGVKASGETTLVFQVVGSKDSLLSVLCGTAGMPCNRKFFEECKGRYGTGTDYVLSNGAFQIKGWSTEEPDVYLRLVRSKEYRGEDTVRPGGIYFTFGNAKDGLSLVKEGKVDGLLIPGDLVETAKEQGLTLLSHYSKTYGLIMNTKGKEIMQNAALRKALAGSLDRTGLADYLPLSYQITSSVVLPQTFFTTVPYPENNAAVVSLASAKKENFELAKGELGGDTLTSFELWYVDGAQTRPAIDYMVQCWQKDFGLSVTLKEVTQTQLTAGLANGSCHMGVGVISSQGMGVKETLQAFVFAGESSFAGYTDTEYDTLLQQAGESLSALQQCEARLLNEGYVIPLYASQSFYAFDKSVTDVHIEQYTKTLQLDKAGKAD